MKEEIIRNIKYNIIISEFVYNYYSILFDKNRKIMEKMLYIEDYNNKVKKAQIILPLLIKKIKKNLLKMTNN